MVTPVQRSLHFNPDISSKSKGIASIITLESPPSLTKYKFSIIASLKNVWNFLVSLFASCFNVFNSSVKRADPVKESKSVESPEKEISDESFDTSNKLPSPKPKEQLIESGIEQKRRLRPTRLDYNGMFESSHFIENDVIIEKSKIVKSETFTEKEFNWKVSVSYTHNGKAIIQQLSSNGSFEAAKYMLLRDHGKPLDIRKLTGRISENKPVVLPHVATKVSNLKKLRHLIIKNGSAIVKVKGSIGEHHIVVDHISKDLQQMRIRDPFHGWEITILSKEFQTMWLVESAILQADASIQLLTPLEINAIEKEIGWAAARQNALKVLSFRNLYDKAIVIEGDGKILCMEIKQGTFQAYYFKDNNMFTLNDKDLRAVKVLKDDEKNELITAFNKRKIDLSKLKGLVSN